MEYTQALAILDTRRHLKDSTQNVWTDADIKYFIDEAIALIKSTLPLYFATLHKIADAEVADTTPTVIHIKTDYTMLISVFASARCFEQDEQNYRAVQKMNEFEARKIDMVNEILDSDEYAAMFESASVDVVKDVYFNSSNDVITPVGLL